MKKLASIFLLSILVSCNDGDFIVSNFDFDSNDLATCGNVGDYVFFNINSASQESISLKLSTTEQLFLETSTTNYAIDGTTNFVNYRKYQGDISSAYFCNNIPPTTPLVEIDYLGSSGTAILVTETTLDDLDDLEEAIDDTIDTDSDEIPDYYDFDDDGDNVLTTAELGEDPLNPRDSDGDGIPDYLDDDDDNDGILTRNEDLDGDLNPANDFTDTTVGPDYLNPNVRVETVINRYRIHAYTLSSDIQLSVENLVLISGEEQIILELFNLGNILNVFQTVLTITPTF